MAYNKPYDPDALPRFAEPEPEQSLINHLLQQKPGSVPPPQPRYDQQPQQPRYDRQQYQQAPPRQNSRYDQQQPRYDQQPQQQRYQDPRSPVVQGHSMYAASPPPVVGQRPAQHTRPAAASKPPPSPKQEQGGSADPTLLPLFRAVDKDGTGQLSEKELSVALVNGDWTAFDIQTVRMMIRMFDSDRSGTIGFDEFCGLWSFLASWRTLFDRFDVDRSGNISLSEFSDALIAFRYRLSPQFVELLFRTYDKRNEGVMSFDLFVQACISLKRMTDVFKKYDNDRDGYITLSFEDFLGEILKQMR
ncbi:Programmed cell death protein 6 [Cladobotryum mycophilum]|uniref:Programmed cell death protein 6 n=1 Tax=Cladobotryum mycophilum TaxID=491253 RepID=A0ABR0SFL4_9HYPO